MMKQVGNFHLRRSANLVLSEAHMRANEAAG